MKHPGMRLAPLLVLLWLGGSTWLPADHSSVLSATDRIALSALSAGSAHPGATPLDQAAGVLGTAGWEAIRAQIAKLTAADGMEEDIFGYSVSVNGDTAVVGAAMADVGGQRDAGAAYVFYRDKGGADAWGQVAKLTAADGEQDDHFGAAVSVDGDTAIVGAPLADVNTNAYHGAVYVFSRDQGGPDAWGQVAKIVTYAGPLGEVFFGDAVSVQGDTAIVGARMADVDGHTDQGAAYVYYRDQGGENNWGLVSELAGSDSGPYDAFGNSVSLSGDTAIVGAWNAWVGANYSQGTAYIFYRHQGGTDAWGQVAKLTAADGAGNDNFGYSVSVSGNTAVVGARWARVADVWDSGAAYVFYRDRGGADAWGQVAKLVAADAGGGDQLGWSVSVTGDTAIVGTASSDPFNAEPGAAYLFYRDLGGQDAWAQAAKLTAADGALGDLFGRSVSVHDDTLVAGAGGAEIDGHYAQGAAYVLTRPPGAADDVYATAEDTTLQVSAAFGLLADDLDPQGDALTAVLDTVPSFGALALRPDGSFTYTPTVNFFGLDTFTYYVNDGQEDSDTATVEVTVTPVNDAPVARDDVFITPDNPPLVVIAPGVLRNDTDLENDALTAVLDTAPSYGTLELQDDGSFTYSPTDGWSAVDTFTYHAHDGAMSSNVVTVTIMIPYRVHLPVVFRSSYLVADEPGAQLR